MSNVTIYTTTWCGFCKRLERALDSRGIDYATVDIEQNPEFGPIIERLTGGFRTVPTVSVGDRYFVNPSIDELAEALETAA